MLIRVAWGSGVWTAAQPVASELVEWTSTNRPYALPVVVRWETLRDIAIQQKRGGRDTARLRFVLPGCFQPSRLHLRL